MRERKEKKKIGLILFMVIIMIGTTFSFVFYGFAPSSEKVKYNDLTFSYDGSRWTSRIGGKYVSFAYLPTEVQIIPMPDDARIQLQDKLEIDATSDLNSPLNQSIALAQYEMALALLQYNIYLRQGFTRNNSYNAPVVTCSGATQSVPVVYFKYGNSTNIHLENNCIVAESLSEQDVIRAKDRMMYGMLGVIK